MFWPNVNDEKTLFVFPIIPQYNTETKIMISF